MFIQRNDELGISTKLCVYVCVCVSVSLCVCVYVYVLIGMNLHVSVISYYNVGTQTSEERFPLSYVSEGFSLSEGKAQHSSSVHGGSASTWMGLFIHPCTRPQ